MLTTVMMLHVFAKDVLFLHSYPQMCTSPSPLYGPVCASVQVIAHKASKHDSKQSNGTRKSSKSAPHAKKRKAIPEDKADSSEPKAQPRTSVTIDKVKQICKAATIKIPPSAYVKTKSVEDVERKLKDLLAKHDLSLDSSSYEIHKTRDR